MKLKDLAKHLGLSPTTVSRALAGYPDVNPETRRRVQLAAKELGYRPSPIARRLRKGVTEAVGVVIPAPRGQLADPFFLELLTGLGEGLAQAGLELLVATSPPGPEELATYRRLVEERRVDALIVARTYFHDERILYLLEKDFPFVAHGRSDGIGNAFPFLDLDGTLGFFRATQHLLEMGHKRVAFVAAPMEYNFSRHRLEGYLWALREVGLEPLAGYIQQGDLTEEGGFRAAQALLSLPLPPTAILAATDRMAWGVLHALKKRGLRPGVDVSVIGYDDLPFSRHTDPPLSTLRQPFREEGRRLVELLLHRLQGKPLASLQEIWVPELVLRGTDGPAPC
ncbi:substrate-binding domain-containing protein [Thermus sp. FJN-A]